MFISVPGSFLYIYIQKDQILQSLLRQNLMSGFLQSPFLSMCLESWDQEHSQTASLDSHVEISVGCVLNPSWDGVYYVELSFFLLYLHFFTPKMSFTDQWMSQQRVWGKGRDIPNLQNNLIQICNIYSDTTVTGRDT